MNSLWVSSKDGESVPKCSGIVSPVALEIEQSQVLKLKTQIKHLVQRQTVI